MRGLPAIASLAALAGEAAEAPLRKLIGELGAAIAASGSGEATVAPVTAAASTGSQHTAPTGQAQHAPGEASRATRRHGRTYLRDASGRLSQPTYARTRRVFSNVSPGDSVR